MESELVLHAKTRNITVTTQPSNNVQLCTEKVGTVSIVGGIPGYIEGLIQRHNLDSHAHPDLWYIHEQGESSAEWHITHNLKRFPSVTVVDSGENVVMGYVTYVDENNVVVTFNAAFKGKAFLN